jgi:hypothetical protein
MRNSLIESVMVGGSIALGVLLIHTLTQGAPAATQLLALLAVGVVLFGMQLVLTLRRTRRSGPPPEEQARPQQRSALRRGRRNPFFRELTQDWTGLDEHLAERSAAEINPPDDLDDLWGEQPAATRRKAAGGNSRPHSKD